jgi:hypothetical protein
VKTKLLDALSVTEFDLEVNRKGHISPDQHRLIFRQKLQQHHIANVLLVGTVIGWILIGHGVSVYLKWAQPFDGINHLMSYLSPFMGLFVLGLVLVGAYHYIWRSVQADIQAGKVASITGRVGIEIDEGKFPTHKLHIEEQSFQVSREVLMAIQNGQVYRLYYAPHSHVLLSAERVADTT